MKKHLILLFVLSLTCGLLIGCQKDPRTEATKTELETESIADPNVIDLTLLSSTLIYAEVFAMMQTPESYLGKTIRMSGVYAYDYLEETEKTYYFVLIKDAEECCQQGLEFVLQENLDYPPDNSNIIISGTFESYEEQGNTYYFVKADEITVTK